MRIGIDIDDTALITVDSMLKYANIYCKEVLKKTETKNNISDIKDRFYLQALYGWSEQTKSNFFNTYYKEIIKECTPKESSENIIRKLKKEGNEIYFISSRITTINNCKTRKITEDTFFKYNIPYDKLIIGANNKLNYCLDNNINIFIDDSYEVLKELSNHGIKCFLMTTPMNATLNLDKKITRVHTWNEIYNIIKEV